MYASFFRQILRQDVIWFSPFFVEVSFTAHRNTLGSYRDF